MTFDRAVPIIQGCLDLDGDGYKDLLVTHHLAGAKFVARYYKGKDDSIDGVPFEQNHQWASTGKDTSMSVALKEHKARWGDLQLINGGPARLFAAGTEGKSNHVIYWDYDPSTDSFDADPTILDVTAADADENKLRLVSVRALPGAVMLSGQDGAYFFKYNSDDTYQISDILFEVEVQPKAQRITVLRTDNSYNVNLDTKQLIIAHRNGADIFDVVTTNSPTTQPVDDPNWVFIKNGKERSCNWVDGRKARRRCRKVGLGDGGEARACDACLAACANHPC